MEGDDSDSKEMGMVTALSKVSYRHTNPKKS